MNQQAKNKNPLLSCALTGGFEDLSTGIVLTTAEKPVFTIGNAPVLPDTDNFSEISLDRDGNSSEIGQSSDLQADLTNPYYTSPLSDLDSYNNLQTLHDLQQPPTLDINSNNQQPINDANINPIAAFGTAASTVFSTFSSIIKGSTSQTKIEEQPQYHQQVQEQPLASEPFQDPYAFNIQQQPDPNAAPPSFFSPDDEKLFNKKPSMDVPSNTFRLGGNKKKAYAHIPGLSSQTQSQSVPQNFNINPVMPPLPSQPVSHVDSMPNFQPPPPLQQQNFYETNSNQQMQGTNSMEKSSNKFSFSSLLDKIPVSMNLFGTSDQNSNEMNYNEYDQVNAQPINYFSPQTEPQIMPTVQQPAVNSYFDNSQQSMSITTTDSSKKIITSSAEPVNFFNPQQFNTSPFSKVQQPPATETINTQNDNNPSILALPPSVQQNQFIQPQIPQAALPFNDNNNYQQAVNNSNNETLKADQSAPPIFYNPTQASELFKPRQSDEGKPKNPYSNNRMRGVGLYRARTSSSSESSNTQQIFMPPAAVSPQLFSPTPFQQQTTSRDSSRPPSIPLVDSPNTSLSGNRSTPIQTNFFETQQQSIGANFNMSQMGFGMPQQAVDLQATVSQQVQVPPSIPQMQQFQSVQQIPFFSPAQNIQQSQLPPASQFQPINHVKVPEVSPILMFSQPQITPSISNIQQVQEPISHFQNVEAQPVEIPKASPPVQKKSDLNVPENENATINESAVPFEQEQKLHEQHKSTTSNVSNFFAYNNNNNNNNNNKVNEQVSALNFFQVEPEVNSQQPVVDCFGLDSQKQDKLASHNDSLNAINFFAIDTTPKACEMQQQQQCIENNNNNDLKMDENEDSVVDEEDDVSKKEENQEFNSPITSSTMQGNDLVNDITDKMESLSACSRSTLSLFATSELDSTMGQKLRSLAPVESLIPKYLEQQPMIGENLKTTESLANHNQKYRPIYWHWFYQNLYWHPFSMTDSMSIEQAIMNGEEVVFTSGGRYEVSIKDRRRSSIYWSSGSNAIRKCSWFYMDEKNGNQNLIPYDEGTAEFLEKEYEKTVNYGSWDHKIHLPGSNDYVVLKDAGNIEHHKMEQILVVKRGVDEFDIDDGEEGTADHLILCVSGFGDKIDENADEVRTKCLETIQQYYSEAFDCGQIKRIEVLPTILNSIDVLKLYEANNDILNASSFKSPSREINEHIMRTMLYSNENFYQKIMNHLAFSLNEIVSKFNQRNSTFNGGISIMSSSYEALFLFDMLSVDNETSEFWKLNFNVTKFFACGLPTSLLMIRNGEKLKHGFELKKCKKFINIIHPADEIAQRIEPLVIPEYAKLPPESIENLTAHERIDFLLPEDSALERFSSSKYFSSEILIRRITNEIYGANHIQMDSGSL